MSGSILQSGVVTPGNLAAWLRNGTLVDSGVPGGPLTAAEIEAALGYVPPSAPSLNEFPVLSYGAFFNGTDDDYPGIQAATNAAAAAGGGVVVYPPSPLGRLSNTVVSSFNNVQHKGIGGGLAVYNSMPTANTPQTMLTWTGEPGGTMFLVGAPNILPPTGTRITNCGVDGILLNGATSAAIGWDIRSVFQSNFGAVLGMECTQANIRHTTSWLTPTTAAGAGEVNDSQGNVFSLLFGSHRTLIDTTITSGGGVSNTTIAVASTAEFVPGMQVQVGTGYESLYIIAPGGVGTNTLTMTTAVASTDNVNGHYVMYAPHSIWWGGLLSTQAPPGYQVGGSYTGTPVLEAGDCSGNVILRAIFVHYTWAGDGFHAGNGGENVAMQLYGSMWQNLPSGGTNNNTYGYGFSLDGWISANNGQGANNWVVMKLGTVYGARYTESSFTSPPICPLFISYDSLDAPGSRTALDGGAVVNFITDQNVPYLLQQFRGTVSVGGLLLPFGTPASSSAAAVQGQIQGDASYLYFATATNTWKRAALSSF